MSEQDSQKFRELLRQGLAQYGLTPSRVPPLTKREPTGEDRLATRLGIQSVYDPLAALGYNTERKIIKLIENALVRPVALARAQVALHALIRSQAAAKWRRLNGGWAKDSWYDAVRELQRSRVEYATLPMPPPTLYDPNERLKMWIHPATVKPLAAFIIDALHKKQFIKTAEKQQAAATISQTIQRHRIKWAKAVVDVVWQGESMISVGVVETDEMQPEGVSLHRKRIVVKLKEKAPGRQPTHSEFLEALFNDIESGFEHYQAERAALNKIDTTLAVAPMSDK